MYTINILYDILLLGINSKTNVNVLMHLLLNKKTRLARIVQSSSHTQGTVNGVMELVCVCVVFFFSRRRVMLMIQDTHGSHRSPEKKFRSINTFTHDKIISETFLRNARMLCAKFGWNLPSSDWEENFVISSIYFRCFDFLFL